MAEFFLGASSTWAGTALADPDLEPGAKYVCLTLAQYMSAMGTMIWPGKDELGRVMGINQNQLTRALKLARVAGYLRFSRALDGAENAYFPMMPPAAQSLTPPDGLSRSGVTHRVSDLDWKEICLALSIDDTLIAAQRVAGSIGEAAAENSSEEGTAGKTGSSEAAASLPGDQRIAGDTEKSQVHEEHGGPPRRPMSVRRARW